MKGSSAGPVYGVRHLDGTRHFSCSRIIKPIGDNMDSYSDMPDRPEVDLRCPRCGHRACSMRSSTIPRTWKCRSCDTRWFIERISVEKADKCPVLIVTKEFDRTVLYSLTEHSRLVPYYQSDKTF